MINPEWLRYFVVVAETKNLREAADRLHLSHQALSHAIGRLEDHFRLKLVDRSRRIRGLTPAGEVFLREVQGIVDGMENLERRMTELQSDEPRGPITIASVSFANNYLLPELLARLAARFPHLRPRLFSLPHPDVERWVLTGEVDIGILLAPPTRPELQFARLQPCPSVIVGVPQASRPWNELAYIVPRLFRGTGSEVLDGWPAGHQRRIVAEVDQLETALNLAEAGLGAAFVPHLSVKARIDRGSLAILSEPPVPYSDQFVVIWRKGVRCTPAVAAVLEHLRD